MGFKDDIYDVFIENLNPDKEKDFEMSQEGKDKVKVLADGLSEAIIKFITEQTFRVDKLSMTTDKVKTKPIKPIMGVTTVGAPGPHTVNPISIPVRDVAIFSMGVDKDGGENSNPIDSGKAQSNLSEVRLRDSDVKRTY
jgi:hypothetical protein|tara:strand:- start:1660 stop:2076 length:417 start_codon:yes stop_codon:yes gene_type:complete